MISSSHHPDHTVFITPTGSKAASGGVQNYVSSRYLILPTATQSYLSGNPKIARGRSDPRSSATTVPSSWHLRRRPLENHGLYGQDCETSVMASSMAVLLKDLGSDFPLTSTLALRQESWRMSLALIRAMTSRPFEALQVILNPWSSSWPLDERGAPSRKNATS